MYKSESCRMASLSVPLHLNAHFANTLKPDTLKPNTPKPTHLNGLMRVVFGPTGAAPRFGASASTMGPRHPLRTCTPTTTGVASQ
jgi:hypothetical protein